MLLRLSDGSDFNYRPGRFNTGANGAFRWVHDAYGNEVLVGPGAAPSGVDYTSTTRAAGGEELVLIGNQGG